jgi:hypothetical protein
VEADVAVCGVRCRCWRWRRVESRPGFRRPRRCRCFLGRRVVCVRFRRPQIWRFERRDGYRHPTNPGLDLAPQHALPIPRRGCRDGRALDAAAQLHEPAMRNCSLEQQLDQPLTLSRAKLRGAPRRESHPQGILASSVSRIAPAHDRNRRTADQPPYLVQRAAFIQELQGAMAPSLQDLRGTTRSHREYPPGYPL